MCDTQTLAYANDGYIIRCPQCNRIQMAFGTVVVVTKEKQLKKIKERAALEFLCRGTAMQEPDLKSVTIPVTQTTMLCLSMKELEAFCELLDQAFALLEVYALLDSVNG
jgi:hypothetical protein